MRTSTWRVAALLFGSGCCALIYQIGWLREFRLIFGASTAASAAVLAIFIGGLGLGGLLLGSRADAHPHPILFYAQLESIVAISAAASPFLLDLVRSGYIGVGGTPRLGIFAGTVVRLISSGIVLAVPTVAMGGTLPAAAGGVTRQSDTKRHDVAALYALNAMGAVVGCSVATFFMLEIFGTRATLWLAAALNLLVAMIARQVDRAHVYSGENPSNQSEPTRSQTDPADTRLPIVQDAQAPLVFALFASATVGFAFFLMELVWYRMLGPLLGGSVFTFGLILGLALAGIGIGGLLYSSGVDHKPASLTGFAWSCLLEAMAMAAAYAMGDRVAILALGLQPLGHATFAAQVAAWTATAGIVVLPTAVIAGYQFPLLIALFGRGPAHVAGQIGLAYAANTVGAIVGSLAGGFGLLPWLTAPGAWRFATLSLVALGATAALLSSADGDPKRRTLHGAHVFQGALGILTVALLTAGGPSAVWRHAGIGAGRAGLVTISSANQLKDWRHAEQRAVVWEGDGTESSVALSRDAAGYAFVVNGKSDGSARRDAGTQVMSGLLGPILNQHARRALVIGLGTGSTAGWLGAIPAMERVDVVELEPLILEVARACRAVNHDAMQNPKVHVTLGDGRETLLTTRATYDVIASEPSNPFRAGIASLFTQEYYRAASGRLSPDGLFVQWMQAYEIDSRTLRTIYATMASVFPDVETWQTSLGDLMLVGAKRQSILETNALRARLTEEPFKTALRNVWRVVDLEGFLAHYVADDRLARSIASAANVDVNTDDHNVVEFGFARSVGVSASSLSSTVRQLAWELNATQPRLDNGATIDWDAVDSKWVSYQVSEATVNQGVGIFGRGPEVARRAALISYYQQGDLAAARRAWTEYSMPARDPDEVALLADLSAEAGSDDAVPLIEQLRGYDRGEADTLLALLRFRQSRFDEAATALELAFGHYRNDPWATLRFKQQAIDLANALGSVNSQLARRMFDALRQPFAVDAMYEQRLLSQANLSRYADFKGLCPDAVGALESHVPWTRPFLELRHDCYAATGDQRLTLATRDYIEFQSHEPLPLGLGLTRPGQSAADQRYVPKTMR